MAWYGRSLSSGEAVYPGVLLEDARAPGCGLRDRVRDALGWLEWLLAHPRRGAVAFFVVTLLGYGTVFAVGELVADRRVQSQQTHYAWLADAFLHGRLDIDQRTAPALSELVTESGKYYVVYPPGPAVLLMPIV